MTLPLDYSIPFEGFYGTHAEDEVEYAVESYFSDDRGDMWPEADDHFISYKALRERYALTYAERFMEKLAEALADHDYVISADVPSVELVSPREYNFETDRICIAISDDDLRTMYKAMLALCELGFSGVCEERHTSRSGFISFYSPVWQTWDEDVTAWRSPQVESLIIALMRHLYPSSDYDSVRRVDMDGIGEELYHVVDSLVPQDVADKYNKWRESTQGE